LYDICISYDRVLIFTFGSVRAMIRNKECAGIPKQVFLLRLPADADKLL